MRHLLFPLLHDQRLVVLQRHILDLQCQIFTELLAVIQHIAWAERVHMHLDQVIVFYCNNRIAHTFQIGNDPGNIKRWNIHLGILQLQDKFCAIAKFQLTVCIKCGDIDLPGRSVPCFVINSLDRCTRISAECILHSFKNINKACTAGINNARLF